MILKKENTSKEFIENIDKIKNIFQKYSSFLFYFSYDPDAIGASIAICIYLKKFHKDCHVFIPEGTEYSNVNFLFDIAYYNNIEIISNYQNICELIEKKSPVFISCDTPNHLLLNDFEKINSCRINYNETAIEIDHHFEGDSEQIFQGSITLFQESNSSCELIAILLEKLEKKGEDSIWLDRAFSRNIIICLLVGFIFDTQNGKFIYDQNNYKYWYDFLSERLKWLTWGNPKNLKTPNEIFEALNKLTKKEKKIVSELLKKTNVKDNVGLLFFNMDEKIPSCNNNDFCTQTVLIKILSRLANQVPEYSGAAGILSYYDNSIGLYYIKIRRASKYKKFDLRNAQGIINDIYSKNFIGGGGHEGATSFRISNMNKKQFLEKLNFLHEKISLAINNDKTNELENKKNGNAL